MVSTICTKTITIEAPGVTRYLCEEECKTMLKTMETKFEVYIIIKQQPWEPLPQQVMYCSSDVLCFRSYKMFFYTLSQLMHGFVIHLDELSTNLCTERPEALFTSTHKAETKRSDFITEQVSPAGCSHFTVLPSLLI